MDLIILFLVFPSIYATKPMVRISASPKSNIIAGLSTLSFASSHSKNTCPIYGPFQVAPGHANQFPVFETNSSKQSASAHVPVRASTLTAKVSITSFVATPDSVPIGIPTLVTLSWTTVNATSVTIDNDIGSVAINGSVNVTPTQDTTYTITVTGPGGTAMASVTVKMLIGHLQSIWDGMKNAL